MGERKQRFGLVLCCGLTAYVAIVTLVLALMIFGNDQPLGRDEVLLPILIGIRLDCALSIGYPQEWLGWVVAAGCWLVYLAGIYVVVYSLGKVGVRRKRWLYLIGTVAAILIYLPWFNRGMDKFFAAFVSSL